MSKLVHDVMHKFGVYMRDPFECCVFPRSLLRRRALLLSLVRAVVFMFLVLILASRVVVVDGADSTVACPVGDDASGMETGEKGLQLIKAGETASAAACFWRAADRAGGEQEAVGWLKNAAQASEQLQEFADAVEAWQQMFDTQLAIGLTPEIDQMVRIPNLLLQLNRQQDAVNAWAQILEAHPNSAEVKANYAVLLQQLGLFAEAVKLYEQALEINPRIEAVYTNMAMAFREMGQEDRAGQVMKKLEHLRAASGTTRAQSPNELQEIGLDQLNRGDFAGAETSFLRALALPGGDNYAIHYNLGLAYFYTQQWDKALASYEKSLQHNPNFSHTYHGIGNVYETNKMFDKALEYFFKTVTLDPLAADTYFNIGTVYQQMRMHDQAAQYLSKSAELSPASSGAYINLGVSLKALGRVSEAIDAYYKAIQNNPLPQAFGNLASSLHEIGRDKEAIEVARQGVALDGNYAHGYNILGTLLRPAKGQGLSAAEAMKAYETALGLAPTFVDATLNLAGLLVEEERFDDSLRVVRMHRRQNDEDPRLFMEYFNLKRRVADWSHWELNIKELAKQIRHQMKISPKLSLQPFQAETYPIGESLVKDIAAFFAARARERSALMLATLLGEGAFPLGPQMGFVPEGSQRLKIGYMSSDFKQHPLSYLINNLFLYHERARFEVFCYATTPSDGSHYRAKIAEECEHFVEVYTLADVQMAAQVNDHAIHILVDLNGYTAGGKTEVFHMHPAPLQVLPGVSYFGTMGGDSMDSYVTDRIGTPPEIACTQRSAAHCLYQEKMVYLPNSYQMNDHKQAHFSILESGPSPRAHIHASSPLEEGSFVFVNFNSYQKIEPALFRTWMDIIEAVENSVLWLLQYPPEGERRLRLEWQARGLNQTRLKTSPLTDPRSNLLRMGAADVHLDTLLFNGHTTTTDSLWAGVPVLTKPGIRHASRVAASSSLQFFGAPEMCVPTMEAYKDHAIQLGRNRRVMRRLKKAVQDQRVDSPLFDTQRWVRDLEKAFCLLWDTFLQNKPPDIGGGGGREQAVTVDERVRLAYHISLVS